MEHLNKKEEICRKVAENFRFAGKITKMSPYGSGHINDTFMLTCELEDGSNKHYILQRMNDDIFRNPKESRGERPVRLCDHSYFVTPAAQIAV